MLSFNNPRITIFCRPVTGGSGLQDLHERPRLFLHVVSAKDCRPGYDHARAGVNDHLDVVQLHAPVDLDMETGIDALCLFPQPADPLCRLGDILLSAEARFHRHDQDQFGQSAPYERLLAMNGITVENIVATAEKLQ